MDRIPNVVTPVRVVGFWQPGGVYFTGVEVSEAGVSDGFVIKNLPESIFAKFREERRGTVSGPGDMPTTSG